MGLRFQRVLRVLPGVRLNLSKSGVSASVGPRGADVNIGRHGVTTNAGIPGTGLSYRSRLGHHGAWAGVALLVGALAFWAGKHVGSVAPPQSVTQTVAGAPGAPPAAQSGPAVRYVHRGGSVLRDAPKASSHTLKKESKGAQVTLLSESDGWSKVTDGNITGWMRSSVLGAGPPR